ncbi:hypothetical protein EO157G_5000 [Escherichia phage SP27]|uniref:Uncharacterized protein n=1 Tax=Escherichia phage SP27 TaxID=2495557 RepID=A0A5A4U3G2_9CAUD|nr:hypothetical protein vBEcoMphAPEC6_gp297c [Escherichia phage vB_EcoM_phAPEC6]BBM62089.1 hypothetical protein EO157G_5000 [Escherichia phage SP27]
MRWKKRHIKRFDKIIKKYYSHKLDPMNLQLRTSIFDRRYPQCLASYSRKRSKNEYQVYRYDLSELFLNTRVSVPIKLYSRVKRSRVQDITYGYLMIEIDDINEKTGRNYSTLCLENHDSIKRIIEELGK